MNLDRGLVWLPLVASAVVSAAHLVPVAVFVSVVPRRILCQRGCCII